MREGKKRGERERERERERKREREGTNSPSRARRWRRTRNESGMPSSWARDGERRLVGVRATEGASRKSEKT